MARIVMQPEIHQHFQRGIQQMVDAIRPTLGPVARKVSIDRIYDGVLPELLDNGGLIARRIIELPQPSENSGAMFLRHLLWRVHESVGDGTATTAVFFETLFSEGRRYLATGGNAMSLRQHLEAGAGMILAALDAQTLPLAGDAMLRQLAESVCYDEELATALGKIFDVIGPFGALETRNGHSRDLHYSYVDGSYWRSKLFSNEMIRDRLLNSRPLKNAVLCITDLELQDPHDLVPLMQQSIREGVDGLVIVAKSVSDQIKALILQNERPGQFDIIAVNMPGLKLADQSANLEDMAMLTGGRVLLQAAGDSLPQVRFEDLGHARRVWADNEYVGIVGGQGDAHELRRYVESLMQRYHRSDDPEERAAFQKRIGRLQGGAATLHVGGVIDDERKARKELAERTASALRGALHDGVLPGGGVALRNCQDALSDFDLLDPDARAAQRILHSALEAPMRTLLWNAGYEASAVMARLDGPGCGYDVLRDQAVDMQAAGIYDSAAVLKMAVQTAISGVNLALTTDVIIHQKNAPQAINP
jgi:chaperonin GroEL